MGVKMKYKIILVLLIFLLCLSASGCICCSGTQKYTPKAGQPAATLSYLPSAIEPSVTASDQATGGTYTASQADKEASNKAVSDAAAAIESNDPQAFTALMSSDVLSRVSGTPDLTTPEAVRIAAGLRSARIVNEKKDAFVYETSIDGTDISFLVIKEDGAWKISGL